MPISVANSVSAIPTKSNNSTAQGSYDEVPGTSSASPSSVSSSVTYNKKQTTTAQSGGSKPVSLRFPLENQERYAASIKFEVHSPNPYSVDAAGAKALLNQKYLAQMMGTEQSTTESVATKQEQIANPAEHNRKITQQNKENEKALKDGTFTNRDLGLTTKPMNRVCKLYFPLGVQQNDNAQYTEAQLGPGGATALGAIGRGNSLMSSLFRGSTEGLVDIFKLITGQGSQEAAQLAAARVSQKFQNLGVGAAAQIGLQVRINPNSRTMFQGVTLRQFTFVFKFIPKSAREAEEVRQIIKLFRTELYPESLGSKIGLPLGYKFPNLFKITYQYNDAANPFMPQPLLCYLRDVTTSYNPGSMSFHADGSPTEIDMSVNFQEFRGLTKQDIESGSDGSTQYGGPH